MKLHLPILGEIVVDFNYEFVGGHPISTKVIVKNNFSAEKPIAVGFAEAKYPDKFSYKEGKKWALISLFKRNPNMFSYEDRATLFMTLCPFFFGKKRKKSLLKNTKEKKRSFWRQLFKLKD